MNVAFRLVSLVLITVALMLLGADLITTLEKGGPITVRSAAQVWGLFGKASEAAFFAWMQKSVPAPVGAAVDALLSLPAWALTGVLGVILAFVFGRKVSEVE